MVGDMPLFRWSTCILIAATLLQSGCTLLTVAKVAATPVGLAGEVDKQRGKVAGKSVVVGGKVAGSAVAGAGRVAVSGTGAGTRVAAASLDAGGSLSAASIRALSQMAAAGMVTSPPGASDCRAWDSRCSRCAPAGNSDARTPSTCRPGTPGPWAQRSNRSASASSTVAPLSCKAKAMSSACQ